VIKVFDKPHLQYAETVTYHIENSGWPMMEAGIGGREARDFKAKTRVSLLDKGVQVEADIVDQEGIDRLISALTAMRALLPAKISNADQQEPSSPMPDFVK
jgi:hypothetical protein